MLNEKSSRLCPLFPHRLSSSARYYIRSSLEKSEVRGRTLLPHTPCANVFKERSCFSSFIPPSNRPPSSSVRPRSLQISKSAVRPRFFFCRPSLPPCLPAAPTSLPRSLPNSLPCRCVFPLSLILKRFSPSVLNDHAASPALHCTALSPSGLQSPRSSGDQMPSSSELCLSEAECPPPPTLPRVISCPCASERDRFLHFLPKREEICHLCNRPSLSSTLVFLLSF